MQHALIITTCLTLKLDVQLFTVMIAIARLPSALHPPQTFMPEDRIFEANNDTDLKYDPTKSKLVFAKALHVNAIGSGWS